MNRTIFMNGLRRLCASMLVMVLALALTSNVLAEASFAGGSGTAEDPWRIETAEQLDEIRRHLDGHYVLAADIDLSAYASWEPIGTFVPRSDAPEDAEVPGEATAFRGTFDGAGHTISNLTIDAPQSMAVGLFGCALGTEQNPCAIGNVTLENVDVAGYYLVGGLVGLQFAGCRVHDVALTGTNRLQGLQGVGGIVGTGFDAIEGCTATADVVLLGDDGACGGLIAGGMTGGALRSCAALGGSVTAGGDACWGLGGLCGAPYAAAEIADCSVRDVTISATGAQSRLIGGLVGFAGVYEDGTAAQIVRCDVENVRIEVSDDAVCVGGIVGGSIANGESGQMGAFALESCSVSGEIAGGAAYIGSAAGNPEGLQNMDCAGSMGDLPLIGAAQ